ncbi:protein kinase [Lysobacter sp. 5GHs7-4]|uniref:serine/threonine-protein kinase n=1 Tax=Lysobacter sp. 5GHs7-4 TaxID=2904253 RepID=UPI001E418445|nr:serine/threonine-protein kinase [Lysobacter sp. 5GHs7-4]UHQ21745.1 protein kinase [Lysobacter sp. 5GHs7-4]
MTAPTARALALFDEYADLPPAERERALRELMQRDPALHAALRSLLEADEIGVLDRSPAEVLAGKQSEPAPDDATEPAQDPRLGTRLGAWRLQRVIGRGGMGTVYEARRDDGEYERRVALKCIRAELATPRLVAAFREERNLLARLDHPGIAPLIDGGVGDDGQPWFALRYVDGQPLDAWCDGRRTTVRGRVELLIQACEALAYAHAQGVVHGDIKPSNLLVDDDGRVHLLDFGIATHFATPGESIAVTPDYAAPEMRGRRAGAPSTDLYALGVLAYRLLCAHWPVPMHDLRQLLPAAAALPQWPAPQPMERLLGDDDRALAARRDVASVSALRRALAGDLSAIALKAVAPQPQDRYASVREFADDLQRWLAHRPVHAAPGGWRSRARKWRQRNPIAAALGVTVLLAVCASIGAAYWQQRRAARAFEASQAVSQLFASTLGTATLSGLGSVPFSSRALLERTERELRKLPLDDQPQLRARSLATLARSYAVIGEYRRAEALAAQAQTALGDAEDQGDFVAATWVAMLNTGNGQAEAERRALARLQRLGEASSTEARMTRVTFGAELARAQWGQGKTLAALATADDLVRQMRALGAGHREWLAQVLILRSNFLSRLYRFEQADRDALEAIALVRSTHPVLADDALEQRVLLNARRISPHERTLADALLQRRRDSLGDAHPSTARARVRVALSRYPQVESPAALRAALATIERAYGREHPEYGWALSASAWAIARDPRENVRLLPEAIGILERTQGPRAELTLNAQGNLGKDLLLLPDRYRRPQDIAEGSALLRRVIAGKQALGLPAPYDRIQLVRGLLLYGAPTQWDEAERQLIQSRVDTRRYATQGDAQPSQAAYYEQLLLFRRGRDAQADAGFAAVVERERGFLPAAPDARRSDRNQRVHAGLLTQALTYRSVLALRDCRRGQADADLAEAVRIASAALTPNAPIARAVHAYRDGLQGRGRLPNAVEDGFIAGADIEETNRKAAACTAPARNAVSAG